MSADSDTNASVNVKTYPSAMGGALVRAYSQGWA